jgi:hypothetical protein
MREEDSKGRKKNKKVVDNSMNSLKRNAPAESEELSSNGKSNIINGSKPNSITLSAAEQRKMPILAKYERLIRQDKHEKYDALKMRDFSVKDSPNWQKSYNDFEFWSEISKMLGG